MKPLTVYLYAEPAAPTLELRRIADYLAEQFPQLRVELREPVASWSLNRLSSQEREVALSRLAQSFARLRIRNPMREEQPDIALPVEVDYERRRLTAAISPFGLAYHGEKVMRLMADLLPREERRLACLHLVFTNQLLATYEGGRYHFRVAVFGFPNLLSTTGVVEAPAKPKEFYVLKQQYAAMGMSDAVVELEAMLGERALRHDDPRLTEVMKGYVMQALCYHLTGEAFCPERDCRLFNAHWQEELIRAQLSGTSQFCACHQRILQEIREERLP